MNFRSYKIIIAILLSSASLLIANIPSELKILAIRVEFPIDDNEGTSGDGRFLLLNSGADCDRYTVDPPPHDRKYFESQIIAIDNYFRTVSEQKFGIDLNNSTVYPSELNLAYEMPNEMGYYHPLAADLDDDERVLLHDKRITELFNDAVTTAYNEDKINFEYYDIVVVFHAGVSQDFNIDLDITPEDIPSTFIEKTMIEKYFGNDGLEVGNSKIEQGIILPETQNHIFYPEFVENHRNSGPVDICEYQYGLTGTFAMMIGQAIGLPALWNTENGQSGVGVFGLLDQGSNNGRGLIPAMPTAWSRLYLDWDEGVTIKPDQTVDLISQPDGKVLKVDITDNEYFLIENRTNWFRSKVNLDSAQLAVYNMIDTIPNVINFIFDSVGVVIDENGVILSVPDYDIGLPGSGLLIWHIDESIIDNKIATNSINNDPKYKGVDLEEAGGSQDIGYVSTALFRDPSIGEIFDMWYAGNFEYEEVNNNTNGAIEFTPYTFPNTNSNRGSVTNLTIGNIGYPSDTIQIFIKNNLSLNYFPDTAFSIIYQFDFDNDGETELIGGKDTLWWSELDTIVKNNFYTLPSEENYYTIEQGEELNKLIIASVLNDSIEIVRFELKNEMEQIDNYLIKNDYVSIDHIISSEDQGIEIIENSESIILSNEKNGSTIDVSISEDGGLNIGDQIGILSDIYIQYISAVDLDKNGKIEILALDENGKLFAVNQNSTIATGYPVSHNAIAPILAQDILADDQPEIVFKNTDGDLLILNNSGEKQYQLSGNKNSDLIMLGEYSGKSTIVTESNIWVFDDISNKGGNEWTSYYGDVFNSSTISIDYIHEPNESNKLIDKKRTYVYPNPVRNNLAKIRVQNYSADKIEIKIYDSAGYFVDEIKKNIDASNGVWETVWDVTNINAGIYFINLKAIRDNNEESIILKLGVIH